MQRFFSRAVSYVKQPFVAGLLVFTALLTLTQVISYQRSLLFKNSRTRELTNAANVAKEKLQIALGYSKSATQTLRLIVATYGIQDNFDSVAASILQTHRFIDAVQLTKGGMITHVYPLQGNEAVIGYDILKDTLRNKEALKAIEKNDIYFAGPFNWKQGGTGIVGRLPIFINNEFYGFSVVLIKLSTLIYAAEIDSTQNDHYVFQLSKKNIDTGKEEFFLPNADLFTDGSAVSVKVPDGDWKIYVKPLHSETFISPIPFSILGFILSLIGGFFAWFIAMQPYELKRMVVEKTHSIIRERDLSDSIINSLPGIFYLYDENGKFIRWNKNFETVSGFTSKEMEHKHPLDFFDEDEKEILTQKIQSVFTKGMDEIEAHFLTKDKRKIPYYFNGHLAYFEGKPYLIGMGIDITERKKIEAEIKASEGKLRHTLDNMIEGVQIIGFNWEYIYMNNTALKQNRLPWEDLKGYTLLEKYPGIETTPVFKTLERCMTERTPQEMETEFTFPDGLKRWFQLSVQPVAEGIFILSIDITERKIAEHETLQQKALSDTIINALPGIFYLADVNGKMLRWNKNVETVTGYSTNEVANMHTYNFLDAAKQEDSDAIRSEAIQQGKTTREVVLLTKQQQPLNYYFSVLFFENNGHPCVLGIGIDITERKKAETALVEKIAEVKERAKELNCLYRISEIANNNDNSIEDVLKECVSIIPAAYQYSEIACARILLNGDEYKSESFAESAWKQASVIQSSGTAIGKVEVFYKEEKPTEQEGPFLKEERDLINTISEIISTAIDRRKAEATLLESEERYRYLFHNNPALIFIWDLENLSILEVNNTALQAYGYTRDELLKMTILQLRPLEFHDRIREFAEKMLTSEESVAKGIWQHVRKNGELMYMDISSHRIEYNNRKAILSLAKDVTEQFKAENELKKTYEDVRRLNMHLQTIREEERAGIAREIHDELGQQLTGLKMDASWLAKKLQPADKQISERLNDMLSLIDTTVKTIRRISSDLRPGILDDLGLIAALEWQSSEFEKRSGIACKFKSHFTGNEPDKILATGIFRIYQETLTNVMRHSGATAVEAYIERLGDKIILTIKDNGHGFDEEKVREKKTLGLVGMKERAVMLGGELQISSKPDEGTIVKLIV
ncbi:MAG: PAS domain S-box protein [Chitinophagales bacterium]|nr:PAS domain S-box protein [Chitinophagales bacterium]